MEVAGIELVDLVDEEWGEDGPEGIALGTADETGFQEPPR
jgi:hypothetical protein